MATTDDGAIAIASLLIQDAGVTQYDASNAYVGVGDDNTAFLASQTDLQAVTNKLRKLVTGAPARTSNSIDFTAQFGTSEGNFEWLEIGLFNAAAGGQMATRRVLSGLGTKTSSETWTITLTVVVSAA